ncbi:MAG TPA: HAMP domain-containing sensor histidine kinase [Caulobacteraceae bacterium]|nr:HAMP domain-containing sensor histidine kinase [Caulobacteraceae bacterium]
MDDQKRSFLRMVSHELRTPLNSIIGFSEIIARELYGPAGAPQYREYAEHVRQSGQKLLRLVNQVLEIARLEGHATDLHPIAEPLDHAADDAVDTLRDEIAARRVRVAIEAQGALPTVFADPRGLRTILVNLLQNAIAFSPEGGEVRLRATAWSGRVIIAIEDDGEGVDEAEIPRLLRPFEQGESALTRSTQGAGLGLPIVSLLCAAMNGGLRLSSPPGQGMTALVMLPAVAVASPPA